MFSIGDYVIELDSGKTGHVVNIAQPGGFQQKILGTPGVQVQWDRPWSSQYGPWGGRTWSHPDWLEYITVEILDG